MNKIDLVTFLISILFASLIFLSPWYCVPATLFLGAFILFSIYKPLEALNKKIADQELRLRSIESKVSLVVTTKMGVR